MKRIFYSFGLALVMIAVVFSALPAAAQSGDLPEVDGYYWWTQTILTEYGVYSAQYDPVDVGCDSGGCSGTLSNSGFFGERFQMVISKTDELDDYMYVFDITFADESSESGQYSAGYNANGVDSAFFSLESTVPAETYRFCKYDTTIGSGTPETAVDWAEENCDVLHGNGPAGSGALITFDAAWQNSPFDFVIEIDWVGVLRLEEEPAYMPFDPYCYIVITDTVTLTDTMGVTSTETLTVEYTADSNLVANYSFEDGNTSPDDWQPVVEGQEAVVPPFYQPSTPSLARTGDDSIYNGGTFELWSDLPVVAGGTFLGGFHARCVSDDCTGSAVAARWNSSTLVNATDIITSYNVYSGTQETGGGASWFILAFDSGEGNVQVDDAFVYPIDENGDLNCDPAYYPNEEDLENVEPGPGGIPLPWAGAGTVCYDCQQPYSDQFEFVNFWIAWLGCVIRNLFACSLRIWLMRIEFAIVGLLLNFRTLAGWIAGNGQLAANWGLDMANYWVSLLLAFWTELVSGLSGFSVIVNVYDSGFGLLEAIINLLIALAQLLLGILDALVTFAELAIEFLQAIWLAWGTPAHGLDEIIFGTPLDGGAGLDGPMAVDGVNDTKIFVYTVWGLMAMDNIGFGLYLNYVQYPILGLFGFVVGKWFLDQMKELMPV